jgi:hypothetical protein|tara:strand:- start:228 stop:1007 length:780 start_codon:yes stop_codon:yes gene_type:complete
MENNMSIKICVVPDTQVKPDVKTDHLLWAGKYIAEKKPDVIVQIGDHWDMESLCSYDKGKTSFEGRRYKKDIESGNKAMDLFLKPIKKEMKRLKDNKQKQWKPRFVFTMGNHEQRIARAVEYDSILEGTIGYEDLNLKDWEVYDYLQPVVIESVAFAHFFTTGIMGRPCTSARAMLTKKMMSTVMGHVQDRDIAYAKRADGVRLTGLFAGMFTQHDEAYLGNQGNGSWKGIWMLNEVDQGSFDELPVSLTYLKDRYGAK